MEHYYSLNSYLQKTFGEKVYKLSLELGTINRAMKAENLRQGMPSPLGKVAERSEVG